MTIGDERSGDGRCAIGAVIQEDRIGCGVACVAAITGQTYAAVKRRAATLGISVDDPRLWSETRHMRTLLATFGVAAAKKEETFMSWQALPE